MTRKMACFWRILQCYIASVCCVLTAQCSALDLVQMSACTATVHTKTIDLTPLKYSLTAQFGDGADIWNYTYNPCYEFKKPEDATTGFGDKCLAVALCKYGQQGQRQYFYTMGFHNGAKFVADKVGNSTQVKIVYNAFRSLDRKKTYIELVCDSEKVRAEDAVFRIIKDKKGLGDVYAELHHVVCCPDGYQKVSQGLDDIEDTDLKDNSSDVSVLRSGQEVKGSADRTKVMIIVGANLGVILMAGVVGLMCYTKRGHTEFYSKVPGSRTVPDSTLWQLASSQEVVPASSGPIISKAIPAVFFPPSSKSEYRDGAPARRKSLIFPVLDYCEIPEELLQLHQRLGGGIFGDTYVGEWTGITVSVKRITLSVHKYQIDKENIGELRSQISFLSCQRHRNIVSVLGYCSESKHPYIISEYITGQVMKDFIKNAGTQLSWPQRVKILSQVADGMAFLHSTTPAILHRDLRCGNLFITSNDVIKICDFGIVNITQPLREGCQKEDCCCQGQYSACPPAIAWTAPEVLEHPNSKERDGFITTASDVYSYAIVMWELVFCDDPYEDINTAQEVMEYVISGGRPEISNNTQMLRPYKLLMIKCWDSDIANRLSFKQITVQLKEVLHQAKLFQKALRQKNNRS